MQDSASKNPEAVKVYEFWTLAGQFLTLIETDAPAGWTGELAAYHGVPNDEIEWEEHDPEAWK
jgi:hypothetical protein